MGIIKTAMMSGAAMYGMKKITESRGSGGSAPAPAPRPPTPRREYHDRDAQYTNGYPDHHYQDHFPPPRSVPYVQRDSKYYMEDQQGRMDSRGQRDTPGEAYYMTENPPQYDYYTPSGSSRPSPASRSSQYRSHGFIEPEDDERQDSSQSGSRADMVNMLAQQAMNMGILGQKSGQKDQGKGDLMKNLFGK